MIDSKTKSDSNNSAFESRQSYHWKIPTHKHIIVASLNWGLGHATRCYPIIQECLARENKVTIASDGIALEWLKEEFAAQCEYLSLPGYNVHYKHKNFGLGILLQYPKISNAIKEEQSTIQQFLQTKNVDLIISDNRYGVYAEEIPSILLTHQLQLASSNAIQKIAFKKQIDSWLHNFQEIWIPDYEEHKLTGILSETKSKLKTIFIGPLSRLIKSKEEKTIDILIILSGPEPKRTELEKELFELLKGSQKNITILRGTDQNSTISYPQNFTVFHLANSKETQHLFNTSNWIISRAGYSTLMDLDATGNKAILIPTPGQSEQEYLAKHHCNHPNWKFVNQFELGNIANLLT